MQNRVYFFDTTLRDGEQSPGATMNLQEKLRLAHQLEVLGVDIMEAGFPASSPGDFESVRTIAAQAGDIQVAGLARCVDSDIDRCWEAVKCAKNPRIHTFLSTSPLHMKHKLRKDPEDVLKMAVAGVKRCASYTDNVEFSAEDFSRSEKDFLCRIVEAAINAGATTINLPDTVGYAQPQEFAVLVDYVIKNTPNSDKAVFSVHCHDDLGVAVANTLAALRVGVRQAEVTLNGIGERAGNASLEEVAMALSVRRDYYGLEHGIKTEQLYPSCRLLSMIIGQPIPNNKSIVGANAFAHESGIHQDGMLKNRETYEIMTPQSVGRTESNLVIGKHSGRNAVRNKFESMGYKLDDEQLNLVFEAVKQLADRKKTLHDDDLMALVQQEIYRIPDRLRLRHVSVQSSDAGGVPPTAAVLMDVDGMEKSGAGFGVGPVDALFNVIADMVGREPELEQYAINAITGGTDALGETWLKVPPTIRVEIRGEMPRWLRAKDLMLLLIGAIGVDGALYKALEFGGPVIDALDVEGRLTMANMAIEAGGKAGLFAVDAQTRAYCAEHGRPGLSLELAADPDAVYERVVEIDVTGREPVVACPHLPSNVKPVSEVGDTPIQQVVIGSCTNGRISDMRDAAEVLRGRKVDKKVRCIVLPSTPTVWKQCLKEGLMEVFMDAGCIVGPCTCGPCLGGHTGILGDGERAVATTNRNFKGRMGSLSSEVYLASPVVAAASAVAGKIASPGTL